MDKWNPRLQRFFDVATIVAAALTLPVVLALDLDLSATVRQALDVLNWLLWGTFVLELVVMLALTPDRRGWLRAHPLTPVIVILTPPVLEGLELFRLIRLLAGGMAGKVARSATSAEGLRNLAMLTLLTIGFGGLLFAYVEPGVRTGEGIYWAVTTVTTVGYGDIVPTTSEGRLLAMFVMVVGALFLAILTGAVAERFVSRWRDRREDAFGGTNEDLKPAPDVREDAVLAKLDDLGERLTALERAVERGSG